MTRQVATNSLGYEVQWLTKEGWKNWGGLIFDNLEEAKEVFDLLIPVNDGFELRVYEVLEEQA